MAINSLSASSNGLSGLISGIDTQSVVEKLLSNTQNKITKTKQQKSVLEMKQQLYRDVSAKLRTLQSSFLSFTSKTNLRSSSFYNAMNATIVPPTGTSAAFSVSASTNAKAGNYNVNSIESLATAYQLKTKGDASGGMKLGINQNVARELATRYSDERGDLVVTVGSTTETLKDFAENVAGKSSLEVADYLNSEFSRLNLGASARVVNNKLTITADNAEDWVTFQGNESSADAAFAMKMFGGASTMGGKGGFSGSIDAKAYNPKFTIELDGRKQDIYLNMDDLKKYAGTAGPPPVAGDGNVNWLLYGSSDNLGTGGLNGALRQAFGSGVQLKSENGEFSLVSNDVSQTFKVQGDIYTMDTLGLKTGMSNKINTSLALKDQNFATALEGNFHSFTINGVGFSFTSDTSLSAVMEAVNASSAGVKMSYSSAQDRFVIERSETGAGTGDITFGQTEGNLLSAMFGVKGGESFSGAALQKELTSAPIDTNMENSILRGGKFAFVVDGTTYTIAIETKNHDETPYTLEEFTEKMNYQFSRLFGRDTEGNQNIVFELTPDLGPRHFNITANNGARVSVAELGENNNSQLGFLGTDSTRVENGSTRASAAGMDFSGSSIDITIGGTTHTLNTSGWGDLSMNDIATNINSFLASKGSNATVNFDTTTAAFRIQGADVPLKLEISGGQNLDRLFGQNELNVGQAGQANFLEETQGENAVLYIDGARVERTTNSFTYEGMTFTLHSTLADTGIPTKVNITRDTEKIVEGVNEFLKVYNETIDYINELYKSDPTYKDYPPLTDEQKAAMSDREVEQWEAKSKEGLLRSDQNLGKVLQTLRQVMYTKPSGSSIAIYDLGIGTSFYNTDGHFEEINAGDLKAAVEKDPDAVMRLFSGTEGVMSLLNNAIDQAAKTSSGSPGYLTRVAGASSYDTSSSIYKQIRALNTQLSTLESKYWKEYDRYWKQFNKMESVISQMNSQSSWLSQQGG